MVFSSVLFLFFFLPITFIGALLLKYFVPREKQLNGINGFLLFMSLLFYAWGEPIYVFLMIVSILMNYAFGLSIHQTDDEAKKKSYLAVSVLLNIGLLVLFKYSSMVFRLYNNVIPFEGLVIDVPNVRLPIGISFFTFQAMSYVIDVYRKETKVQKSVFRLGLYISFFPQLIAGPIVRYHDIAQQLSDRNILPEDRYEGMKRFLFGLGKKVLIANNMAIIADEVFALANNELTTSLAWISMIAYSLQIYFDFSGYSDMAIGLGRLFGFKFLENFNYPYISKSIQEFWRRWHMSLSSWFRDYLYIPLGGNRKGELRTYLNQFIVFLLCGLWHGASWNFVFWGAYHGLFLTLEKLFLGKILKRIPNFLQHLYTLIVVLIGWIFFRAESFSQSLGFLKAMFGFDGGISSRLALKYLVDREFLIVFVLATIGSTPLFFKKFIDKKGKIVEYVKTLFVIVLFILSLMYLSAGTYNPFIYFRF